MGKLSPAGKIILGIGVLVVLGALIWYFSTIMPQSTPNWNGTSTAPNGSPSANGNPPAQNGQAGTGGPQLSGGAASGGTSQHGSITFITPVAGDIWTITQQNPIQWSREAGVTGQIVLLNATSGKMIGVILNQIGPHQTSFTWNTRDLLLSRTSPSKTTVTPGRYVVRISFDGNSLPFMTSVPITLVAATP